MPPASPPPSAPYVLVIEDDPDIIDALDLFFSSERIQWRASHGDIDGSNPPAVALLDLSPGGSSGPVSRRLRELNVPIIVVSASVDAREIAERIGAQACLTKPYELPKLLELLMRIAPSLAITRNGATRPG
jgi:DNA-binding response OmpR family regulator